MSVVQRGKKGTWYMVFKFNGKTYRRSTKATTEQEALDLEAAYREQLKNESTAEIAQTIAKARDVSTNTYPLTHTEQGRLIQVQHQLETDMLNAGLHKYTDHYKKAQKSGMSQMQPEMVYISKHIQQFADAIGEWLGDVSKSGRSAGIKKSLRLLEPEAAAFITLKMCIDAMGKYGPRDKRPLSYTALQEIVGRSVKKEVERLQFFESPQTAAYWAKVEEHLDSKHQKYRETVLTNARTKLDIPSLGWSKLDALKIGAVLIRIMVESTGTWVLATVPKQSGSAQPITVLLPTNELVKWLKVMHETLALNNPEKWPMVIPPLNWDGLFGGGYLESIYRGTENRENCLVSYRTKGSLESMHTGEDFLSAINTIQNVAWQIDTTVLSAVEWCWDKGGGSEWGDLPIRLLKDLKETLPQMPLDPTPEQIKAVKIVRNELYDEFFADLAKRTGVDKQILMARKFVALRKEGVDKVYFPWYADWRGRLYPVVSYISPQGNQVSKGLLKFHEGKRLGKEGVEWFLIHGANCYAKGGMLDDTDGIAVDKLSLVDRIAWVKRHHVEIEQAGNDYKSNLHWLSAEKPFAFLQFCVEYAQYCKHGEDHVSHICTAWDGVCSGVQHMSLTMLDYDGALATSLLPQSKQDRPSDIYTDTAHVATKFMEDDLKSDAMFKAGKDEFPVRELAGKWLGKIDRSFVKSNVMTLSYGSGTYGRRDQIKENTRDKIKDNPKFLEGVDKKMQWAYVSYAASKINDAVQVTVSKAYELMKYLQTIGRMAAKGDTKLNWTTDTGFTVVQDYPKTTTQRVKTFYGGVTIRTRYTEDIKDSTDASKHAQGIVPNFIHSLDAEHLQRCVLEGSKQGISSWGMIHDSFGTHASDAGKLHEIIREQFVDMYKDRDRIKELRDTLCSQVSEEIAESIREIPMPQRGDLDVELVKAATYCFN